MMRSSVEMFWALFAKDSLEDVRGKLRNDAIESLDIRDQDEMSILSIFDPAAFAERLPQRLRELTERLTSPYQPDEPDDAEALFIAAHLQASRLAFYLIQSAAGRDDWLFGYGEDAGLYTQPLEELIARLRRSMPRRGSPHEFPEVFQMSIWTIESFAERVEAELAGRGAQYPEALERLADSLTDAAFVGEFNDAWEESENPEELVDLARACPWRTFCRAVDSGTWFAWTLPWLSEPELRRAAQWFEELKAQPAEHNWFRLARTFDALAEGFVGRADTGPEGVEIDDWDWDVYWLQAKSWAENELTPEERLHKSFTGDQWGALCEDARNALISAERIWISSRNRSEVLDHLQVATEIILHSYFCEPGKESDAHFVRDAREHFKRLRKARNLERHTANSPLPSELRDIYGRFLGIGPKRPGILPELVRILTQPPPK